MSKSESLDKLRQLQTEVDELRAQLGYSTPRSVLYLAPLNPVDDEIVIVEADGFGGAVTSVIEGNYPIDFITHNEEQFVTEAAAIEKAETLIAEQNAVSIT